MVANFASLPGKIMSAIASLPGKLAALFLGIASAAVSWGRSIIMNFLAGLQSAWNAVVSWVNSALSWLSSHFPHSPVEQGPLKGSEMWGYNFGMNIASGLRASTGAVQAAMTQMLGGVGLPGGGLNLGISGSFSGPSGIASSFGGSPVIHVHVHNEGAPVYLDGRQLAEGIGPHLVRSIAVQTGWRRPT